VIQYSTDGHPRAFSHEKIRPSSEQPALAAASNGFVPIGAEVLALGGTALLGYVALSGLGQRTDHGWEPAAGIVEGERTFAKRAHTTRARVRAAREALGARVVYDDSGKPVGTYWPKPSRSHHDWCAVSRQGLDDLLNNRLELDQTLRRGERTERDAAVVVACWLARKGGSTTDSLREIGRATNLAPSLVRRAIRSAVEAGVVEASARPRRGHTLKLLIDLIDARIEQRRRTPVDVRELTERLVAADPALDGAKLWTRHSRELVRKLVARGIRLERIAEVIMADGPISTGRIPAAVLRHRLERLLAETPAPARTSIARSPLSLAAQATREALEREAEQEASARPPGARSRDRRSHGPVSIRSIIAEILPKA